MKHLPQNEREQLLRLLEALGHVEIDREGNRLRQVRRLSELAST